MYPCVIEAVRRSPYGKNAALHDINVIVANCLTNARDRDNGRAKRARVTSEKEVATSEE